MKIRNPFPKLLVIIPFIAVLLFTFRNAEVGFVFAQSESEKLRQLTDEIARYESEITRLRSEAATLSNQIAQYDAQITLTELKIYQTQEKIEQLGGRIDRLEVSLDSLGNAFKNRAEQTYTMSRLSDPTMMILLSSNLEKTVSSFHYLKLIQESDRDLLGRLESAHSIYREEKHDQELLFEELEQQRNVLGVQKAARANLLVATRNDERRYQEFLASARAEFEAIQAIIAGKGEESKVGEVPKGARIASIIQGASCNSSGAHLHLIVKQGGSVQNPFNYLKEVDHENCSGSSCGSGDGDSFNPSGSWDWPISPTIRFTQGYGSTWATRNTWVGRIYSFHNGVDVNGSNPEIRAVESGTLYQGSYGGSGGCRLRYVRLEHEGSDIETLYLHINY
jgi:peptidoglycan hydrolase CwlO-like protein